VTSSNDVSLYEYTHTQTISFSSIERQWIDKRALIKIEKISSYPPVGLRCVAFVRGRVGARPGRRPKPRLELMP